VLYYKKIYKTFFRTDIYSYINTRGNWENSISRFPKSHLYIDITVYINMENVLYLLNIITLNSVYSALLWVCGFIFFYRLLLSFTYKTKQVYVKVVKRFGMYPCIDSFSARPYKRMPCTEYGFADSYLRFGACYVDENTTIRFSETISPNSYR
jgi:hypothetical protein